jgi:hypothetical protein
MHKQLRQLALTGLCCSLVLAKSGQAEFYEPGLIIALSVNYFKEHQDFLYA